MEKYLTLFVLSLSINGLRSQISIFGISGPAVIRNVKSFNEKGTSVVNIINDYESDSSVDLTESRAPVVFDGKSRDSSIYENLEDDEMTFPTEENEDYENFAINNQYERNKVYKSLNTPLVTHGTAPAGVAIQNVRSGGDRRSSVVITNVRDEFRRQNPVTEAARNIDIRY